MWRLRRWWEAGLDRGKEKEFSAQDKKRTCMEDVVCIKTGSLWIHIARNVLNNPSLHWGNMGFSTFLTDVYRIIWRFWNLIFRWIGNGFFFLLRHAKDKQPSITFAISSCLCTHTGSAWLCSDQLAVVFPNIGGQLESCRVRSGTYNSLVRITSLKVLLPFCFYFLNFHLSA